MVVHVFHDKVCAGRPLVACFGKHMRAGSCLCRGVVQRGLSTCIDLAVQLQCRESGKKGVAARKAKEREEKEAYKLALREERERLQAEEASIRYYPIDDLELLEENRERAKLEGM